MVLSHRSLISVIRLTAGSYTALTAPAPRMWPSFHHHHSPRAMSAPIVIFYCSAPSPAFHAAPPTKPNPMPPDDGVYSPNSSHLGPLEHLPRYPYTPLNAVHCLLPSSVARLSTSDLLLHTAVSTADNAANIDARL